MRSIALEKGLVVAAADLSPDRRLHSSGGHARALYAEMMAHLATRTKTAGGALASVVERFITTALEKARQREIGVESVIHERLTELSEMTGGYDFAEVVAAYWRGYDSADDGLRSAAVRWLRGELSTRSDARKVLGVRTIIDDDRVYDHLKLLARFVRLAGYGGLVICLDELVNLYKLAHTTARHRNYEQILRILNDCLQGASVGLGFLLGGTPEFLMDPRRGLFSYEALRSRLAESSFVGKGLRDYTGPVIRLANLCPEELYILLARLRHVCAQGDPAAYLLPDEALSAFMDHCSCRIGEAYFRTPRNTIRAFLDLLAVLEQNPGARWQDLLGDLTIASDPGPGAVAQVSGDEARQVPADDELASLVL